MGADPGEIVVIGGGNAALCAALSAVEAGARVRIVDRAPHAFRGGNTRHTRNVRDAHAAGDGYVTGPYSADEFLTDLTSVTGDGMNPDLAELTVVESQTLPAWMWEHGVRWQPPLNGTLHLARTNHFFLGGGKALLNAYYRSALERGVEVTYECDAQELVMEDARCVAVKLEVGGETQVLPVRAVVVASGGFEANKDWLRKYWGARVDNIVVRGTPYNQGSMLRFLLDMGARRVGSERAAHAIAVDARAPEFDGGIVTRLDAIPLGIAVNRDAARFHDEGEDIWPKRYATWGARIADQPGQLAYAILDSKVADQFIPGMYRPVRANSVADLGAQLGLEAAALVKTVNEFNAACPAECAYALAGLDDCATDGLRPPKSHWARPIDTPPFFGYPMRMGITFTYLGVSVDRSARVICDRGSPLENVFAAGEVMAGNILTRGYLAGIGMTIGSVFGRIAGREAAAC